MLEFHLSLTKVWESFGFKVKYNENNVRTFTKKHCNMQAVFLLKCANVTRAVGPTTIYKYVIPFAKETSPQNRDGKAKGY